MILDYMEKTVVRRAKLLNILYCNQEETLGKLSFVLECSPMTVVSDVEYLQNELEVPIKQSDKGDYGLKPNKAHLDDYLHKLYATSTFLTFLQYFFIYENKIDFLDFIKQQKVSTAKGYRMRQEIVKYIAETGLELKDNQVCGNQILLRFLRAELVKHLNMQLIFMDEQFSSACEQILTKLEEQLGIVFTKEQHYLYQLLMNQSILVSKWDKSDFDSDIESLISAKMYPTGYCELVKEYLSQYWSEENYLFEEKFALVVFLAINPYIFDENLPVQMVLQNELSFFALPKVNELISEIKQKFIVEKSREKHFYTALYIYLRDAFLGIQNIKNSCKIMIETPYRTTKTYYDLVKLLEKWNHKRLKLSNHYNLILYKRMAIILTTKHYSDVVIVSEQRSDALFLRDYLQKMYSKKPMNLKIATTQAELLNNKKSAQTLFLMDKAWHEKKLIPATNVLYISFPLSTEQMFEMLMKLSC